MSFGDKKEKRRKKLAATRRTKRNNDIHDWREVSAGTRRKAETQQNRTSVAQKRGVKRNQDRKIMFHGSYSAFLISRPSSGRMFRLRRGF